MAGISRVLVIEDEAQTRERLARAIAADAALQLCGTAANCAEARGSPDRVFCSVHPDHRRVGSMVVLLYG